MQRNLLIIRWGIVGISCVLFVFMFVIILNSVGHHGKTKLTVQVAPEDSTITINGTVKKARILYLNPGTYKIAATKDGFTSDNATIALQKGHPQITQLLPIPSSSQAQTWLRNHPDIQAEREKIAGDRENSSQALLNTIYPLINKLPQTFSSYSISYDPSIKYPEDPNHIAILIQAPTPDTRQQALQWIRSLGYNPADYEIVFSDIFNPFNPSGD